MKKLGHACIVCLLEIFEIDNNTFWTVLEDGYGEHPASFLPRL